MNEADSLADAARPVSITAPSSPSRRSFCRPWMTLLIGGLLWLDACSLPNRSIGGVMLSGRWLLGSGRTHCYFAPGNWVIVETPAGLSLASDGRSEGIGYASAHEFIDRDSVWATVRTTRSHSFSASARTRGLTAQETATLRAQAVLDLQAMGDASLAARIASGDGTTTTFHWSGFFHNLCAGALAIGFFGSLRWVGEAGMRSRRQEAIAKGICPRCGYEISGLPGRRCPECNEDLRMTPDGPTAPAPWSDA